MFRIKIFLSILVFSFLLIGTSLLKNETREIEKKIITLNKIIFIKEKDINETQLDLYYLTSPSIIEKKIENLDNHNYEPMKFSNIFLSMSDFIDLKNKYVTQDRINEKIQKK